MKIWLPALRVGTGVDVFTRRLAEGLTAAGHEPVLQWFPAGFEFTPWRLRQVPPPPGTDIIHAGSWQAFALQRSGVPLIVTEHHYIGHPQFLPCRSLTQRIYHDLFVRRCVARSYRKASAVVAVSHTTAEAVRRDFDIRVEVVHNWIDTAQFAPPAARVARQGRPFRLIFVGNPARRKGSDLLPTLARELGSGFEILYLGGLRNSPSGGGLPGNIRVLPRTAPADMPLVYAQADAALIPARYEAFGYVALEAMACGLPVVGFNSTGTAEIVSRESGLLSPIEDLAALLAGIRQLAAMPEPQYRRMGDAGRQRAIDCFNETAAIRRYLEIYTAALR